MSKTFVRDSVNPAHANTLDVRLPEGAVLFQPLAGPATRFAAWLIDLGLCLVVLIAVNLALIPLRPASADAAQACSLILFFAVPIAYGIAFESWWRGQTPGKRALCLRVADAGGRQLKTWQVIVRNLLRAVDALPHLYLVGGASCLATARAQRLGDLAAGTVVVHTARLSLPDLVALADSKHNTLRGHPVLAVRLRARVGPAEAELALQAVRRRDALDPTARMALFREMAARFHAVMPLPEDLREGLTDEQYVRNVVEVLFHARRSAEQAAVGAAGR